MLIVFLLSKLYRGAYCLPVIGGSCAIVMWNQSIRNHSFGSSICDKRMSYTQLYCVSIFLCCLAFLEITSIYHFSKCGDYSVILSFYCHFCELVSTFLILNSCFTLIRCAVLTLQAQSLADLQEWLRIMDGKEPVSKYFYWLSTNYSITMARQSISRIFHVMIVLFWFYSGLWQLFKTGDWLLHAESILLNWVIQNHHSTSTLYRRSNNGISSLLFFVALSTEAY